MHTGKLSRSRRSVILSWGEKGTGVPAIMLLKNMALGKINYVHYCENLYFFK
jgi:hypothetical protein